MRRILIAVLVSLFATCAQAQTGNVLTLAQLLTEIGSTGCSQPTCLWPDNTTGLITPFDLRQVGLDLATSAIAGNLTPLSVIIAPTPSSTNKALVVNQSLPNTGTQTTAFDFNKISAANPGYSVPLGGSVDPIFGIVPHVSAFTAYLNVSGPSSGNDNNGLWGAIAETATVGFIKGITGSAYSNINSGDQIYGTAGAALTGSSANIQTAVGVLSESISAAGGTIVNRFGFLASGGNSSNVQGTTIDAAYGVFPIGSAPFKNALFLDTMGGTAQPLASNGSVISSDGAFTTGSLINLPSATLTTDIINVPHLHITAAGITSTSIVETINQNATTSITVNNNDSTASGNGFSLFAANNSANFAFFGIASVSNASALLANRAFVQAGSGAAGIVINNQGANPILFGISNAVVGGFDQSTLGQLDLGLGGTTQGTLALFNSTSTGATKLATANTSATNFTATLPANTGTISETNLAETRTANLTMSGASFGLSGNISAPAWTTNGIRYTNASGTLTDTTSSGTVAVANTSAWGGNTIAASSATTFTKYVGAYFFDPVAGTNVTITNDYALGADSLYVNGAAITFNGLASDATHTDRTVCQDTTSKTLFFGSGAAGICLGTSSERFKRDIASLDVGLQQIKELRAVSYKLDPAYGDPDKTLYGFTAEQGETVLPKLVGLDDLGRPQTFDYMGVVPVLVRAVQELAADNDNMHTEIEALKRRFQ